MTTVLPSDHVARLGVAELQKICAQGAQLFREVCLHDVGIDGFIEVVLNGRPTGILVGVQVKTGDSYVSGDDFAFTTDRGHLIYWSSCMFPVVGIVHQPSSGRSVSLDITGECTESRIDQGPYRLTCAFGPQSTLTPTTLVSHALPRAIDHLSHIMARGNSSTIVAELKRRWTASLPASPPSTPSEREDAWRELVHYMLSPVTSAEEAADAAYRLSWYLPGVPQSQEAVLDDALRDATDSTVRRLLGAASHAEDVAGEYAEHVVKIIARIPDVAKRLERLLASNELPPDLRSITVSAIEVLEGEFRTDLRQKYDVP